MDTENPIDANPSVDSSTTETTQAVESQQTTEQTAAEPSLQEVAKAAYEKATESQSATPSDVPQEDKTEEVTEVAKEEEPLETKVEDLPFHDHPRWQEVTKKNKELSEQVEQMKPWEDAAKRVQYHDAFVQEHNIQPEDFAKVMDFLALRQEDPARARELLKPFWDSLSAFDENVIPLDVQKEINDIEQRVKDSEISRPLADRQIQLLKNEAKARIQAQANQRRTAATAEQQQRQVAQSIGQSVYAWEQAAVRKDPSFKPKSSPTAKDGVYEITAAKYSYLASRFGVRNAADATKLLEQAHAEAKALFVPAKANGAPRLTSRSSAPAQRKQPETVAETVADVARRHGYSWTPPQRS